MAAGSTEVYIDGTKVEILSDISISRSAADTICSCSFSTPVDLLAEAQSRSSVFIQRAGSTLFNGMITSYSLQYQGSSLSLSLDCSDLSFILAHSLLPLTDTEAETIVFGSSSAAMMGRLELVPTVYVGDVIEALLTGTGIIHEINSVSQIGLRTTAIPEGLTTFAPGTSRLDVIQALCKAVDAIFYLRFAGDDSIAICDVWDEISTTDDFVKSISVSDATHIVDSFSLDSVPEMVCTRVSVEVADDDATTTHGEDTVTGATAPYIDIYQGIDPLDTRDVDAMAGILLDDYAICIERASIVMVGSPAELFNQLNLSGLYTDIGISPSISTWRITEIETSVSAVGVTTSATLVSPAVELLDRFAAGSYTSTSQFMTLTADAIDKSGARVGVISATDAEAKRVTVDYAGGGESEVIKDRSV